MKYRAEMIFHGNGLPAMTNRSYTKHWRARMAEARKWKAIVRNYALIHNLIPETPLKKAKLTFYRFSSSEPDDDGLTSGFKHIRDGLKEAGIIEDDKMSNVGRPDCFWDKAPRNKGYVKVIVEEV